MQQWQLVDSCRRGVWLRPSDPQLLPYGSVIDDDSLGGIVAEPLKGGFLPVLSRHFAHYAHGLLCAHHGPQFRHLHCIVFQDRRVPGVRDAE
jgi:hypothetical protein